MVNSESCSVYYDAKNNSTLVAKNVFLEALPVNWFPQQEDGKHGIDYTITINDNSKSNGIVFHTFIKKVTSFKKEKSSYSVSLNTSKLKYIYSIKKPVFLILVDVDSKSIHWLLLQKYLEEIEESKPSWRNQKTISMKIPSNNILDCQESFRKTVLSGHKYVHLLQYRLSYISISNKLKAHVVSKNVDSNFSSSCSCGGGCSSESCASDTIEYNLSDIQIENSLKMAQAKNVKNLRENREAYHYISDALEQAGYNASPNLHYMAAVEKHYHDAIYYLIKSFDNQTDLDTSNINEECLLNTVEKLTNTITSSIDDGEVTTVASIMLRMADVYNNAFSYLYSNFKTKNTFSLLDYAHSLLEMADNMVTSLEVPDQVLQ
ncbi:MAG: DUF4365 domain-containing protein [Firmicutes bacterium]|nr:DUF4365 domain-containing protein [Bacillota bacterium]